MGLECRLSGGTIIVQNLLQLMFKTISFGKDGQAIKGYPQMMLLSSS